MIIGNGRPQVGENQYKEKMNQVKSSSAYTNSNPFIEDLNNLGHVNSSSTDEMTTKSMSMLHERYKQGLISLEEFNRKAQQLNRQK